MAQAVWRLFPTQIESDLAIYCRRSIGEWHRGEMSSRELLVLIYGLPEHSEFKKWFDRAFRVVEKPDGELYLRRASERPPVDAKIVAEYIDWTHEEKVTARVARELAAMRAESRPAGGQYEPDLTGLFEPLQEILARRQRDAEDENRRGANSAYRKGLYSSEGR